MVPDPFFRAGKLAGSTEYRNLMPKFFNEGEEGPIKEKLSTQLVGSEIARGRRRL